MFATNLYLNSSSDFDKIENEECEEIKISDENYSCQKVTSKFA